MNLDTTISKTPPFNHIHKRLVVLYGDEFKDMREIWKQVRRDYRADTNTRLPKSLRKNPDQYELLTKWVEQQIESKDRDGVYFLNKSDLAQRGWNNTIIEQLSLTPEYQIYLGRGRWAYYYEGNRVGELEDSEEFIVFIDKKVARQRRQKAKKTSKFGTEFIQ